MDTNPPGSSRNNGPELEPPCKKVKITSVNFKEFLEEKYPDAIGKSRKYYLQEQDASLEKTGNSQILYFDAFLNYDMVIDKIPTGTGSFFKVSIKPVDWARAFFQRDLASTTEILQNAIVNLECFKIIGRDRIVRRNIGKIIMVLSMWMMSKFNKESHIDPWSFPRTFQEILHLNTRPTPDEIELITKTLERNHKRIEMLLNNIVTPPAPEVEVEEGFWDIDFSEGFDFQSLSESVQRNDNECMAKAEEQNFNDIYRNCVQFVRECGNSSMNLAQIGCALTRATIPNIRDQIVDMAQFTTKDPDRWRHASQGSDIAKIGGRLSSSFFRFDFGKRMSEFKTIDDFCPVKRLAIYRAAKFLDNKRLAALAGSDEVPIYLEIFNSEIMEHNWFPTIQECDDIDEEMYLNGVGVLARLAAKLAKLNLTPGEGVGQSGESSQKMDSLPPPQNSSTVPQAQAFGADNKPTPMTENQNISNFQGDKCIQIWTPVDLGNETDMQDITIDSAEDCLEGLIEDIFDKGTNNQGMSLSNLNEFGCNPCSTLCQNDNSIGPLTHASDPSPQSSSINPNSQNFTSNTREKAGNGNDGEESPNSAQTANHSISNIVQQNEECFPIFSIFEIPGDHFHENCLNGGGKEHALNDEYTGTIVLLAVQNGNTIQRHAFSKTSWNHLVESYKTTGIRIFGKVLLRILYSERELKISTPSGRRTDYNSGIKLDEKRQNQLFDTLRYLIENVPVNDPKLYLGPWAPSLKGSLTTKVLNEGSNQIREDLNWVYGTWKKFNVQEKSVSKSGLKIFLDCLRKSGENSSKYDNLWQQVLITTAVPVDLYEMLLKIVKIVASNYSGVKGRLESIIKDLKEMMKENGELWGQNPNVIDEDYRRFEWEEYCRSSGYQNEEWDKCKLHFFHTYA